MALSGHSMLRMCKGKGLDHAALRRYLRVGLRRGTWAGLSSVDKALYRCGLWVAKARGRVTNTKLSASIIGIVTRLVVTVGGRIYALGLARARTLWSNYTSAGVLSWAPEVKPLFSQTGYIMYLGVMELQD